MKERPNVLLIMSDQHNPHVFGCVGDPIVRTPHLNRLAAQGIRFTSTYCASPLCVPSRMSFLTSRHPSDIGVWSNACMLPSDLPTFAHGLGAAGYETVLGGRMHFVGPDQRHGVERRLVGDVLSSFPGGRSPDLGHIPTGTTGQSRIAVEIAGPGRTAYQAYDVAVTDACCRYLKERDRSTDPRPFCLVVGFVLPHCPFICPKDLYEEYFDQIEIPALPPGYLDRLHPAVRQWRERRGVNNLSDEQIRRARAAYYGLVTYMDQLIGQLIEALSTTHFSEDTVIVYTSDHGDMAGEHGMWWKSNFYEGSAGVPMIWSWPGHFAEGKTVSEVTSLLDIGPTLLHLGGAEPLPDIVGKSLIGFLTDASVPDWPDEAFSENYGGQGDRPGRMIRHGPWKLNLYHGYETPQLFNLREDPDEFEDRANDPECAEIRQHLLDRVLSGWSGDRIEQTLERRRRARNVLVNWTQAVQPADPDFWEAPPGCNVFPEE